MATDAPNPPRDHGGGIDALIANHGETRADWLDLSTGINPVPYPLPAMPADAMDGPARPCGQYQIRSRRPAVSGRCPIRRLCWPLPGASALIARIPALLPKGRVLIRADTYNEHAGAFAGAGWDVLRTGDAEARVVVHPNNPTGDRWDGAGEIWGKRPLVVVDESFCDETLDASLIHRAGPGVIVLKSIGKFWGLAGMRLGAAIGDPAMSAHLAQMLGPWPVSGPALAIGTAALSDTDWAEATRQRVADDAARLDKLLQTRGARPLGGTSLFRLYDVPDATSWQTQLAKGKVHTRIFPYAPTWLRLGLPHPDRWGQLERALSALAP